MSQLTEAILFAAKSLPEGGILSPKEFLHLGSRAAVDQALSRLAKEGHVLRVARGTYVLPVVGRFGSRSPSTETVVAAIEAQSGETIVANGAASANALGLTTQVPTRELFITSGRSRTIKLGARSIELKHSGAKWQFVFGKSAAGMGIRALAWLGPERAHETLVTLRTKLPATEWEAILAARAILPGWMAKASSEVSAHG
ncbi:MAG: DUF6088 family protein [Sulfuricella sp.]